MKVEYTDFIGIYSSRISREICDGIIQSAEKIFAASPRHIVTPGSQQTPLVEFDRHDYSLNATVHLPQAARIIDEALDACLQLYMTNYFVIKQIRASSKEVKIQKTPPRGGYHFWHCEHFNKLTGPRVLAWMIYLNDIPVGEGETEFIWQKLRVQPEAGKCLIWPTQFTHTHRGNTVYSKDKYIATGWYTFDE